MGRDYVIPAPSNWGRVGAMRSQRRAPPDCPGNLRRGGGRKDTPGWTEQKRKTNRWRFDELRPYILTAVTIILPGKALPWQLEAISASAQDFCKKNGIPARAVWEGPNPHIHIALARTYSSELESRWRARLNRRWQAVFGRVMPERAFLWKPAIQGQRIASYLSKTQVKGVLVKGRHQWLTFTPCWETGFRSLVTAQRQRKADTSSSVAKRPRTITRPVFPRYTQIRIFTDVFVAYFIAVTLTDLLHRRRIAFPASPKRLLWPDAFSRNSHIPLNTIRDDAYR